MDNPRNSVDVYDEINGRSARPGPVTAARTSRTKKERPARSGFAPARKKLPDAGVDISLLAQAWFNAGEEREFRFPFNVNYLALAMEDRIATDPVFSKFREGDTGVNEFGETRDQQIHRWVAKMVERWWADYADGTITAGNAKDYFLGYDWDDLRGYAHSCLQARYLVEHGVRRPRPEYPDQREFRDRLAAIHQEQVLTEYWEKVDAGEEGPNTEELDPEGRDRLHSFAEKRRKK